MRVTVSIVAAALVGLAAASPAKHHSPSHSSSSTGIPNTATGTADIAAARATAKTSSPTSHVRGKVFDRFVIIWNENTDFDKAQADRMFKSPSS
jgi:hypothetical protein